MASRLCMGVCRVGAMGESGIGRSINPLRNFSQKPRPFLLAMLRRGVRLGWGKG